MFFISIILVFIVVVYFYCGPMYLFPTVEEVISPRC